MLRRAQVAETRLPAGICLCVVCLVCVAVEAVAGAPSPFFLLRKSIEAEDNVAYQGVLVASFGHNGSLLRQDVLQLPDERTRIEVLDPPEKAGELIVSDGHFRTLILPRKKLVIRTPLPSAAARKSVLARRLRLVSQNFTATMAGRETVAGRSAYVLVIKPKNYEGTVRKMWLDTANYLRLRTERYAPDGGVLNRLWLEKVDYHPHVSESAFRVTIPEGYKLVEHRADDQTGLSSPQQCAAAVTFPAIVPAKLPGGLEFESGRLHTERGKVVLWLRYIDGLNSLSVFERDGESMKTPPDQPRFLHRGACAFLHNGVQFVLVGQISHEQLMVIANYIIG